MVPRKFAIGFLFASVGGLVGHRNPKFCNTHFELRKLSLYQDHLYSTSYTEISNLQTNNLHLQCKYLMSIVDPKQSEINPDNILEDHLNESDADLLNLLTTEDDCTDILNNIATNEQFERLMSSETNFVDEFIDEMKKETRKVENTFKCFQCSKVFKTKKLLKKHLFIHTGVRKFACDICSKTFKYRYEVDVHKKSHNKPTFQCDICSKMFIHKSHLTTHRRKHLNEFVAFCKECNMGFVTQFLHKTHINLVHKNLQLVCDVCGARLSSLSSLKEHKLTHDPNYGKERSHVCEICGKSYLNSRNLKGHMKIHKQMRPHVCNICGKSVSSKKILETHIKMHTGLKDFICKVCNKGFASKEYLEVHHRIHTGNKPFSCELCGKRFTQKTSLTVHMRHHTGQRPYKCECGKEFTTKSHLMTHYKAHDVGGVDIDYISRPEKKSEDKHCPHCPKSFPNNRKLKRHLIAHSEQRPYSCDICSKKFKRKYDITVHKRVHGGMLSFQCDFCEKILRSKGSFMTHRRRHLKDYIQVCKICGAGFVTNQEYNNHMGSKHGTSAHICDICGRGCYDKAALQGHMAKHAKDYENNKYECNLCNKTFLQEKYLKHHFFRMHKDGGQKFICDLCGKRLNSKTSLRDHLIMHSGLKPIECKECGKGFALRTTLKAHLRIHTGDRPYVCNDCGKAFTQKTSLTIHLRYHSGERPYVCDICQVGFIAYAPTKRDNREENYQKFEIDVNGQKELTVHDVRCAIPKAPQVCKYCDKVFANSSNLKAHVARHEEIPEHACPKCGKTFSNAISKEVHLEMMHTEHFDATLDGFVCKMCDATAATKTLILRHFNSKHRQVIPTLCDVCGKCFSTPKQLKRHAVVHFHDKPHACQTCGKSFKNRDALNGHMSTHDDFKYVCEECGKEFKKQFSLQEHLKKHAGEFMFLCPICDKRFVSKSAGNAHMKTHARLV
ncbi:hypothetical protein BDFB_001481 [Asbolus verrucosus]|uniref:C2H2-type domain-containing protein n=1 Tax=Asbolus verrucosus TaxID=1661398 RepID=A0A482VIU9_ASBVE|nr:hypothetical protein BDFB_001481 [Asbolus verrucosus]